MTAALVVVGAGPSGLGCAVELAATHRVEIVERTPVTGGESGWRDPQVHALTRAAARAGVTFRLGATAMRWTSRRLLVASPGSADWLDASTLFYAGGLRPATAIDLAITGDRPAGILPATVAAHLLEAGVALWDRPVILGAGPWAEPIAYRVRSTGGRVTVVTIDHTTHSWADESISGASDLVAHGRDRVRALEVTVAGRRRHVACDAVILAADPHPNRNVDGALQEPAPDVVFVQPLDGTSITERSEHGRRIARNWLAQNGEPQ